MDKSQFTNHVAGTWVFPESLKATVTSICSWINYPFDDADWAAIDVGLQDTNIDAELWFHYPLIGRPALQILVARDVNATPVGIEIRSGHPLRPELQTQIETTLSIFNSFDLRMPGE